MTTYFRDFADADGISDWTEVSITGTTPAWSIVSSNQVQATTSNTNAEALTWNDIDSDSSRADAEILTQFYVNDNAAAGRAALLRLSGSGGTGYSCRVRTSSLDIFRFTGATNTSVAGTSVTLTSATWHWVRFRVNGSSLKLRVWADGGSEPGTWDIDTTDSTYSTAGSVGMLHGSVNATYLWRKFGVGTAGDTAPSSAASAASSVPVRAFPRPIMMF